MYNWAVSLVLLVAYSYALHLKEPELTIQKAKSSRDKYSCTCTDPIAGTIYLFNQIYTDEVGREQFSAQVTIDSKSLNANLSIPDMKMVKFDQFMATTCAVSKNVLFVLGKKIPDANGRATNTIVKWNLETYELLQYNQLDPSLDEEYFHDMALDPDFRLLFAISSRKMHQLDMNCLDLLDVVHSFPYFDEDKENVPFLSSVVVNPVDKKVYISMEHTQLKGSNPGAIYSIAYQRETLSKTINSVRVGTNTHVKSLEINPNAGILFAGVYYSTGDIAPINSSIITFTIKNSVPKVLSIYNAKPYVDGVLPFVLRYSIKDQKLFSLSEKNIDDARNFVCQYNTNDIGAVKLETCITVPAGTNLNMSKDETGLLLGYTGSDSSAALAYLLAVIVK